MMLPLPQPACDCHVHVIGPSDRYPMLPDRQYTPGLASVNDLRAHLQRTGVERAVIIQPSFYGTDNRCTLDALDALSSAGRGIAVVDRGISDKELAELNARGMRGIRLNLESSGDCNVQRTLDDLTYWATRLATLNWHVQVYASFPVIVQVLQALPDLPVPIVIDHFAMAPAHTQEGDPAWATLLHALQRGSIYVKLSAPYRIGAPEPDHALPLVRSLLATNPDRLLWASDWPHTNRTPGKKPTQVSPFRPISSDQLRSQISVWLNDENTARKVLVVNPAKLYGF